MGIKNKFKNIIVGSLSVLLGIVAMTGDSLAETESPVACIEGPPQALAYGDHTTDCEINSIGEADQFTFTGAINDHVRFNVMSTTTNMDPLLEVRDSGGNLIDSRSCSQAGCTFSLDMILPASDTYLLMMSDVGNNEAGGYLLQLEKILPALLLQRLDYDMTISDLISPQTDIDHYYFNAVAGTSIRLNAKSTLTNMDPTIEVYDPNGTLVLNGAVDGASCNQAGCTFSVDLLPAFTGTYTLIMYDAVTNEPGDYMLSLWCILGDCNGDGFPDSDSYPVISYITTVSDSISPELDADFFRFNATAGTSIRLNAKSTLTNMDPTIEVYDPNGTLVLNGAVDGASCNQLGCTFSVDLLPAFTGTYSLIMYDAVTNEPGDYMLSLWCVLGDCDSDADGLIDNDREIINYGKTVINDISPEVDGDFYLFKGTAGDQIRLIGLSATTNMDPTIEVYDPNGTLVINGVADGASCSQAGCTFSVDLLPLVTGTYSVALYDLDVNEPGRYQLGLECVFSPGDFVCDDITSPLPVCDNCSVVSNPDQRNTNGDDYGNICDPDFNGDLVVAAADLAYMKSVFFTNDPDADLNNDGSVNAGDLSILKSFFFQPPGPSCEAPNTP